MHIPIVTVFDLVLKFLFPLQKFESEKNILFLLVTKLVIF